jgi:hypothetical protein
MRTKQDYISIIKMHKDLSEEGKQKLYDILENNEFTEEVEKRIHTMIIEDRSLYIANPPFSFISFIDHIHAAFLVLKDMIFKKK